MFKSVNDDSTSTSTVSRRSLAGGAAALLGMAGAAKASLSGPDAELLRLCAEFHRQHTLAYDDDYLAWEDALAETNVICEQLKDMVPVTEPGHCAKVKVAFIRLDVNDREEFIDLLDHDTRFALETLRGLVGRA